MKRGRSEAFTLVEMLVVVTLIGVLVALLTPALFTVWQVAQSTQCKNNLATIYQAHGAFVADTNSSGRRLTNASWAGTLRSYLENRIEVLRCPASGRMVLDPDDPPPPPVITRPNIALDEISFGVYGGTTLKFEVPLVDGSRFYHKITDEGNGRVRYDIEDGGGDNDNDITVYVQYEGARPRYLIPGAGNGSANRFDLRIKGQPWWGGEIWQSENPGHIGEKIDLGEDLFGDTDYGVNIGAGMNRFKEDRPTPDPRLFFILDYAKPWADYTHTGVDDAWAQFFILDPEHWTPPSGYEDWTWQEVQCLRHFGRANVLFCDGHIETLGPEADSPEDQAEGRFLGPLSPLWRYTGR